MSSRDSSIPNVTNTIATVSSLEGVCQDIVLHHLHRFSDVKHSRRVRSGPLSIVLLHLFDDNGLFQALQNDTNLLFIGVPHGGDPVLGLVVVVDETPQDHVTFYDHGNMSFHSRNVTTQHIFRHT